MATAIRTSYVEAKIDRMQKNNKCRLCGEKDETVYHKISEYRKLT